MLITTLLTLLASPAGASTTDTGSTGGCYGTVIAWPDPGATDVYYRTQVEFVTIGEYDPGAYIELDTAAGVAVSGTSTWYPPDRVVFAPDVPLQPLTAYEATLNWTCGPTVVPWTTSGTGAAVGDPSGVAWRLDFSAGRFVEPPGVGSLLGAMINEPIVLGIATQVGATVDVHHVPTSGPGTQDICIPTESMDDQATWEDPWFHAVVGDYSMDFDGFPVDFANVEMSGRSTPVGARSAAPRSPARWTRWT